MDCKRHEKNRERLPTRPTDLGRESDRDYFSNIHCVVFKIIPNRSSITSILLLYINKT